MNEVKEIPIEKIRAGGHDQRIEIDDETLDGLVASIGRVGLVYPIVVSPAGDEYLLVEGHRRFAAHKRLGRKNIPCFISGTGKSTVAEIAFAGNFFRKDLSPVELSAAIKDVYESGSMTVEEISKGFSKSVHWVNSMMAICDWPSDILEAIHHEKISVSAASNLVCVTEPSYRAFLVRNAVDQGATARTTSAWLQAFRSMQPQEEAINAELVSGGLPSQPVAPQAPCFCCSQIFAVNEMSHIPVCGQCVQIMRNVGQPNA